LLTCACHVTIISENRELNLIIYYYYHYFWPTY